MPLSHLKHLIRDVADFPSPGILFRDITPLLLDANAFGQVIDTIAESFAGQGIDRVAAIESRGFVIGSPLARSLGCGFVPIRKEGKLPRPTVGREYTLEYGTNRLEMHRDAIEPGQKVLVVDDVLATGGTARAAAELVRDVGGVVVGVTFLLEISVLEGRKQLPDTTIQCLLSY